MSFQKLLLSAAAACLLAVFVSGPAQAQLAEIIEDFCEEVALESEDANDQLRNATKELEDCSDDFADCSGGFSREGPAACIRDFLQCTKRANRDQEATCNQFGEAFEDAYDDALRQSRLEGGPRLERRFQLFLLTESGATCLAPAAETADLCAGLTDDD